MRDRLPPRIWPRTGSAPHGLAGAAYLPVRRGMGPQPRRTDSAHNGGYLRTGRGPAPVAERDRTADPACSLPTRCASKDLSPRSWERADHRVLYFQLHDTTDPGVVTNPALRSTRHLLLAGWLSAGRCWADRCGWWGAGRQPEGEPVDQVSEDGCGDCWRGDDAHRARGHSSADRGADGGEPGEDSGGRHGSRLLQKLALPGGGAEARRPNELQGCRL